MERFPAPTKAAEFFEILEGEILMLIRRLRKVGGDTLFLCYQLSADCHGSGNTDCRPQDVNGGFRF